jgi:hypothetical protein
VKGNPVYFEYRLKEVLVSSIESSGAAGGGHPGESVNFNYANVEWSYRQFAENGTLVSQAQAYWDIPSDAGDEGPGNSPPIIGPVASQVIAPGQAGTFFLHIFDEDTPARDLVLSVVTDRPDLLRDLQLAGTEETRTLGFTTSPLYTGIAAVTVKVSDGKLFRSVSFAVQVGVEMTPFEAFLRAYFTPEELLDQQLSSAIGDPDGDDLATVMEFGLGTNPREFTPMQEAVRVTRIETPAGPAIQLDFWRHKEAGMVGPVPWMAPESLRYNQYRQGNPLYTETTQAGENPLYEKVSATIQFGDAEADVHFIRMAVELD